MNPYFTEMLMTNILLIYYAKIYLCTAQSHQHWANQGPGFSTKKCNPSNIYHFTQQCTGAQALGDNALRYNVLGYKTLGYTYYTYYTGVDNILNCNKHPMFYILLKLVKYSIFTREKLSNNLVLIYVQLWFCGGFNLNPDIQTDWLWLLF